ncbi:MAG TPA: sigma-70 family RNA polymerase sigma factor [Candidatus Dormibacteraeota bacterium]|nr:sigma-70 family RNA polymerase sigma factor [Candidatus Dormibacteraeota bacterium]
MSSRRPDPEAEALAERWVGLYGDLALRTAYLFLRDRGLAEDCVQDAFVSAWRARSSLRDPGAERAWLMTIVANTARSHLRRRIPIPTDTIPADPTTHDPFAELALSADLHRALDQLPIDQREVIVMRVYLDLSVEETARALKVAEGTVKSRLSRALEALRLLWIPTTD